MTDPVLPAPPKEGPASPAGSVADAAVRAELHRYNLECLKRIPHSLDYVAPQEILKIMRLGNAYQVDWTVGLEPTGKPGEVTRVFAVHIDTVEGVRVEWRECRARLEHLLGDVHGVLVPDGDIVWAQQLLGLLQDAVETRLAISGGRA
jgi:hypothetical protein